MSRNKWVVRWYDAEEHAAYYGNWDTLQCVIKRLVESGIKVEVSRI